MEAPQEVLFSYACETCCHYLPTFFFRQKVMPSEANLESPKEQEVTPMTYGQHCGWLMVGIWPKIITQLLVLCNC
jgi:hypothetical protein